MGSNVPMNRDELKAMADQLLRAKRKPDPAIMKLAKKAAQAKRKRIRQDIAIDRWKLNGGRKSRKNRLKAEQEKQTYGTLGPASGVRIIKGDAE